ncbi:MAG: hypothetical protein WA142_04235 [Rugosibacter sp.]
MFLRFSVHSYTLIELCFTARVEEEDGELRNYNRSCWAFRPDPDDLSPFLERRAPVVEGEQFECCNEALSCQMVAADSHAIVLYAMSDVPSMLQRLIAF